MPGKTSKFSVEKDSEFRFRILDIINESEEAISIAEIQAQDMTLTGLSSQKISKLLANLIEMGLVRKGKSKSRGGRMVYKSVSKLIEQGYEIDEDAPEVSIKPYNGMDWELEEEIRLARVTIEED